MLIFHWFKEGCCNLKTKVCAGSTGYPLRQACPGKGAWLGQLMQSITNKQVKNEDHVMQYSRSCELVYSTPNSKIDKMWECEQLCWVGVSCFRTAWVQPTCLICLATLNLQTCVVSLINVHQETMIRNYHNHKLQTNPRHREEEPHNTNSHRPSGRQ